MPMQRSTWGRPAQRFSVSSIRSSALTGQTLATTPEATGTNTRRDVARTGGTTIFRPQPTLQGCQAARDALADNGLRRRSVGRELRVPAILHDVPGHRVALIGRQLREQFERVLAGQQGDDAGVLLAHPPAFHRQRAPHPLLDPPTPLIVSQPPRGDREQPRGRRRPAAPEATLRDATIADANVSPFRSAAA